MSQFQGLLAVTVLVACLAFLAAAQGLSAWKVALRDARRLRRGPARIQESAKDLTDDGEYGVRLQREIDRITGKEVYHGQKEQL